MDNRTFHALPKDPYVGKEFRSFSRDAYVLLAPLRYLFPTDPRGRPSVYPSVQAAVTPQTMPIQTTRNQPSLLAKQLRPIAS
jgi:hypothetical protein